MLSTLNFNFRAALLAISLLALLIRAYIVFLSGLPHMNTDTYAYFDMANAIIRGEPYSSFPNGYPLAIALIIYILGADNLPFALKIINTVMSTAVVVIATLIAKRVAGPVAAILCGITVCFWPNQLNYTRQFLTETPASFFLVIGIWACIMRPSLSGLFLWLSAFIRSTLLPVVPLISVGLVALGQWKRALLVVAGLVAGLGIERVLLAWGVIMPSNNLGPNLLISIASDSATGINFSVTQFGAAEKAQPFITYLTFAIERPVEFLHQRCSALWELWGPWPSPGDAHNPRSNLARVIIGLRFPLFVMALLELWRGRKNYEHWIIGSPLIAVTLVHIIFFSTPRFTHPVEPMLIILASMFVARRIGKSTSVQ